jgi:hypothetical protein
MFTPELDEEVAGEYGNRSRNLQYRYLMADEGRRSSQRIHKIAKISALLIGLLGPATAVGAHYEHLTAKEVQAAYFVEGLAGTAAVNGIRMSREKVAACERAMDLTASQQQEYALDQHLAPLQWAVDHEPFEPHRQTGGFLLPY